MIDPTPIERHAMSEAAALVGEYLEHVGQTDIAKLTPDQYDLMIETCVTGYVEALQRLTTEPPADGTTAMLGAFEDADIPF